MKPRIPGYITEGDLSPFFDGFCLTYDGTVIDVTGATVRFHMRLLGADTRKIDAAGEVVDGPAGHIRYRLQAGDTDTPGTYLCEYEVTYGDGRQESFPNSPAKLVLIIAPAV